jgi:hypothetical protein
VIDVGVGEADVEPDRVERRGPGDRASEQRELGEEVLDRPQVEQPRLGAEAAELGERREEDVQLTAPREVRHRARHVTVAERDVGRVDVEPIHRPAARHDRTVERPLPIDRERLAVERAHEVEVDRVGLERNVLDDEHRATDAERHLPAQA